MEPDRVLPSMGTRAAGAGLVAVGAGLFVPAVAGAWPLVPFGVLVIAYGVRKLRVAAIAGEGGLLVRNSLRTHRLTWSEIVDMGYHERDVSSRQWSLQSRRAGSIYTRQGRRLWIDATETSSILLNGTHLSDPDRDGPSKLERLRRRWRDAVEHPAEKA